MKLQRTARYNFIGLLMKNVWNCRDITGSLDTVHRLRLQKPQRFAECEIGESTLFDPFQMAVSSTASLL